MKRDNLHHQSSPALMREALEKFRDLPPDEQDRVIAELEATVRAEQRVARQRRLSRAHEPDADLHH